MKLLADTHVVLWSATDPQRLAASAQAAIEDGANELSVSIVTAWESAIKQSLGKLDLPAPAEQWLPEVLRRTGFEVAEIGLAAALRVRALPCPIAACAHLRDCVRHRFVAFQVRDQRRQRLEPAGVHPELASVQCTNPKDRQSGMIQR